MKKLVILALLSVTSLFASNIEVKDAYVRATPPGLPNSAAFMTIVNESAKKIDIVKVSSTIAKSVELHTHDMKNGVMSMYQVPKVTVPKKGKIVLKPGGFHVMFIGLHKPLQVGNSVVFTLELANGETKTITAPVKSVMGGMNHKKMDHSKMDHSKMNHMKHSN